jgi:peptidoglycan/xylan/chitin deacetylase (PgdA/CDA1 family)
MRILNQLRTKNLVLNFHTIPSSDWFRNSLNTIKKIYRCISIDEIESYFYSNTKFHNRCHICFDDGHQSVYNYAFPILQETNTPATIFISPKVVNKQSNYWFQELSYIQNILDDTAIKKIISSELGIDYQKLEKYMAFSIFKCMKLKDILSVLEKIKEKHNIKILNKFNITQDQLLEMNKSNLITFGAHTNNHPILNNESLNDAENEILSSLKELSAMTGTKTKYFSYPNGQTGLDYGKREQKILEENNIKLAFNSFNNFYNKTTDPLNISRSALTGSNIEKNAYLLGKLFCVPIWNTILDIRYFGKTENNERKEIKNLSIF